MPKMRFMEQIRRKGRMGLMIFLAVFLLSIPAGLGVGMFGFKSCSSTGQYESGTGNRTLVPEGKLAGKVMLVNDEPITSQDFSKAFQRVELQMRQYMPQATNDPGATLALYNQTASSIIYERVMLEKADELGLKIASGELREERDKLIESLSAEPASNGANSLLGDIAKKTTTARERNRAFTAFLTTNQLTQAQWEAMTKRQLLLTKVTERLTEDANEVQRALANEQRAEIDQRLAEGESFAGLATEFSDEASAANGGFLDFWLPRGLFLDGPSEDICFATPVGETTPWIDLIDDPLGVQRYEIVEEQFLEGEEFEAKRAEYVQGIRDQKEDEAYEPSETELRDWSRQIKVRQLVLYYADQQAASEAVENLIAKARIEINDPYILASQAMYGDKIQPPVSMDIAALIAIAENAPVGDAPNYDLMRHKLDLGRDLDSGGDEPVVDEEPESAAQDEGPATLEQDEPATAADLSATEAATDEAAEPDPDDVLAQLEESFGDQLSNATSNETAPLYPLAIGLLLNGIQAEGQRANGWSYYMIGKICLDWLEDDEQLLYQSVDRAAAREVAETNLAHALESLEYRAEVFALRGMNLAWLSKTTDDEVLQQTAKEMLAKAITYGQNISTHPVYETIRTGYDTLEDEEGLVALNTHLDQIRALEAEQRSQEGVVRGGKGEPIQFDFDDAIKVEEGEELPGAGASGSGAGE